MSPSSATKGRSLSDRDRVDRGDDPRGEGEFRATAIYPLPTLRISDDRPSGAQRAIATLSAMLAALRAIGCG